jgi:hypothetical protein
VALLPSALSPHRFKWFPLMLDRHLDSSHKMSVSRWWASGSEIQSSYRRRELEVSKRPVAFAAPMWLRERASASLDSLLPLSVTIIQELDVPLNDLLATGGWPSTGNSAGSSETTVRREVCRMRIGRKSRGGKRISRRSGAISLHEQVMQHA